MRMNFRSWPDSLPSAAAPEHSAAHQRTPAISVVVPTYKRPALLLRCLEALLRQTMDTDAFEVLVVDDGHSDATRELVESLARREPGGPTLRYLRPESGRGPAVARNRGWRAARASLVAFTDDDTIPAPDWLARGERAMRTGVWVAVGGRVIIPRDVNRRPTDHERMTGGLASSEFVTANAFVRRAALRRVHGFDQRFQSAWREDADLQFRLQEKVGPVGRCEDAVVLHPVRPERSGLSLRQQRDVYFDALLYRKHRRLVREHVRPQPPWNHYAIIGLTIAAAALALDGSFVFAAVCAVLALALVLQFALRRLRGASLAPAHVLEMLLTSAAIPFLSVYWRLRGALHYRVWFL